MKWIFRYLRGTSHVSLVYDKNIDIFGQIIGNVDSNYAEDLDRRRSLIEYVFTLCGSVLVGKQLFNLQLLCQPLKQNTWQPQKQWKKLFSLRVWLMIYVHNMSWLLCIVIAKMPYIWLKITCSMRESNILTSKCILLRMWLHRVLLYWKKIPMVDNPTNMMTKSIPMIKFKYCLDLIGVSSIWRPLWGVGAK